MIDILKDLMHENISVNEIMESIANCDKQSFTQNIPLLLTKNVEMTSDLTTSKYQTMIHEEDANVDNNRTIPVVRTNERNYTLFAAGTLPHSTPLLGQRGNFPTSLNSFRPNATLQPLKNL